MKKGVIKMVEILLAFLTGAFVSLMSEYLYLKWAEHMLIKIHDEMPDLLSESMNLKSES